MTGVRSAERVWRLLAIADALVQPGGPSAFNDYRFPSKLPDYLASGKPVVLPATNIGRYSETGWTSCSSPRGSGRDLRRREAAGGGRRLRQELGANGKAFALRELRWSKSVEPILELYGTIA